MYFKNVWYLHIRYILEDEVLIEFRITIFSVHLCFVFRFFVWQQIQFHKWICWTCRPISWLQFCAFKDLKMYLWLGTIFRYIAWPFTILQNDNIMISWDFFQADSTKVSQHDCWWCQPEKISWYCNIIIL